MTMLEEGWSRAGEGTATTFADPVEGVLREVRGPGDVLLLSERIGEPGWERPVILVHEAGGTTLGPLLGSISAVVSTKGTIGAHIALLAKEFGCPCIVGAVLNPTPDDGVRVLVHPDGSLWAEERG
jgi:phosphohistidine swiveling domain-containing protein